MSSPKSAACGEKMCSNVSVLNREMCVFFVSNRTLCSVDDAKVSQAPPRALSKEVRCHLVHGRAGKVGVQAAAPGKNNSGKV